MNRKAVSPLVAAVLLIAATMSIAGVLAYWASSFVRTQTIQWENTTITSQCNFMDFNIYSCKYANNSVTLVVENIRTIPLKDLVVYVYYPNGTVSDPFLLNKTISSSAIVSFIDVVNATSDFSKLIIKSLSCPDIAKEASCVR